MEMAIGQRQTEAMALYEQLPMPRERQEEWRHTRIDRFDIGKFLPFSAPGIALSGLSGEMRRKGVLFCSMGTVPLNDHSVLLFLWQGIASLPMWHRHHRKYDPQKC